MNVSRRTFLAGAGSVIALPYLESLSFGLSAGKFPVRMAFVMFPNGANPEAWNPTAVGPLTLSETLSPLKNVKDYITVFTGLAHDKARAHGDGPGDHARANAVFLTGAHPVKTNGSDIKVGVSIDQFAAQQIGDESRLPSLEMGLERGGQSGNCDSGYSCAYSSNVSWRTPTSPMAKEVNPRNIFERLFGDPKKAFADRDHLIEMRQKKSVIDAVLADAKSLRTKLGAADQDKMDDYLEGIRSVEKQIQAAEKEAGKRPMPPAGFKVPEGVPKDMQEHGKVMFDLLAIAFQSNATRIATFVLANEGSDRTFPFLGVNEGHHTLSHHGKNKGKIDQIKKIDLFYVQQFAYLVEKLKSIKEGDGNLLDNCMIVYGSANGDGDRHNHDNLPVLMAGKGGKTIPGGQHLKMPKETPMCNLFLSMLDRMGVKADKFGDSNGRISL
jgi:hypothetical protein